LEGDVRQALQNPYADQLCGVLLRLVVALERPAVAITAQMVASGHDRHKAPPSPETAATVDTRLYSLLLLCLSRLDFNCKSVRKRVKPAMLLLKDLVARGKLRLLGRLQLTKVRRYVGLAMPPAHWDRGWTLGWRRCLRGPRARNRPNLCSVSGCCKTAHAFCMTPDRFGCAGQRCSKHRPRLPCNVLGCVTESCGNILVHDEFGPAGARCVKHGARQCSVRGCKAQAKVTVHHSDEFGDKGRRCHKHGISCQEAL